MARACAAVVNCAGPGNFCVATVPLQVSETGQPILLATGIDQIPASIRAVLTCRCHGGPAGHRA